MISFELTDSLSSCRQQQEQHQLGTTPHSHDAACHHEGCDITGWWLMNTGVEFDRVLF